MHENGMLVAACGITQSQETSKELDENWQINEVTFLSTYICQLSSLVSGKGYGKALLEQVLDAFDNVWLRAMPGAEAFYKSVLDCMSTLACAHGARAVKLKSLSRVTSSLRGSVTQLEWCDGCA